MRDLVTGYLGATHKITGSASYIYENQSWNASLINGLASVPKGNIKVLNVNASYAYGNGWAVHGGYFLTNGNNDTALYAVTSPDGNLISDSPKTDGYVLELDRHVTQNIQLSAQYRGFVNLSGLQHNVDGNGRNASDNNTLWLSVFFAF